VEYPAAGTQKRGPMILLGRGSERGLAAEPEPYDAAQAASEEVSTALGSATRRQVQQSWSNVGIEAPPAGGSLATATPARANRRGGTSSRLALAVVVVAIAVAQVIWLGLFGYLAFELLVVLGR